MKNRYIQSLIEKRDLRYDSEEAEGTQKPADSETRTRRINTYIYMYTLYILHIGEQKGLG